MSAAYGLALEALTFTGSSSELLGRLQNKAAVLEATRPTAINLKWALDRMLRLAERLSSGNLESMRNGLVTEAQEIHTQDIRLCKAIGDAGAELIPQGARVLTHCNAGALATGDYGTALGVIRSARDKISHVWVDETRPFLQGARLTAWELMKEDIPVSYTHLTLPTIYSV